MTGIGFPLPLQHPLQFISRQVCPAHGKLGVLNPRPSGAVSMLPAASAPIWGPRAGIGPGTMPLTDVAIRSAKPNPKPSKIGDSLSLFLLVQPAGEKLWRRKYRVDGKEKKSSIGSYPVVGLAEARRRRDHTETLRNLRAIQRADFEKS